MIPCHVKVQEIQNGTEGQAVERVAEKPPR